MPKWLRVAALAYGAHGNNGHATFKRGDAAAALGKPGTPLTRQQLHGHIRMAVEFGWLVEGSTSMCLIVPSHVIDKGRIGEPKKPCKLHGRRERKRRSVSSGLDASLKVSGAELDASPKESSGNLDALRSAPISYPNRNLTVVPDHQETA